jgi:putative spermidine/putrescine transport system permease protein
MLPHGPGQRLLAVVCALVTGFLIAPIGIVVLAAFSSEAVLRFPPEGFSLRWFEAFFDSRPFVESLSLSLGVATAAAVGTVLIGTAAAFYGVRRQRRLVGGFRLLIVAPLQLPHILTAIALLVFFHQLGFGAGGVTGLVIGHILITLPYVYLTVSAFIQDFDTDLESAARTLGAGPVRTFGEVTLPLSAGAIASGALMAFLISFDQFPISLLLGGVGNTTLPVQMYEYLRFDFDPVPAAASVVSILLTVVALTVMSRLVGVRRIGRT